MLRVLQRAAAVGRNAQPLTAIASRSMTEVSWARTDGTTVPGLSFGDTENPGVVVVQEWWGLDDSVKAHAQHIADMGYHAVVPDLYRGTIGVEAEEAQHLMDNLDWPGALDDIAGAVAFAGDNGAKKVGAIGFCMGGALSLAAAVKVPGLSCAIPCYGTPPAALADVAEIKCPVQGHFGATDGMAGFSSLADANALRQTVQGVSFANLVYVYPGVGHAFLNDLPEAVERKTMLGMGTHDPAAVALAWDRIEKFFSTYLKDVTLERY